MKYLNPRWLKWAVHYYLVVLPQSYYYGAKIWWWKRMGQWEKRIRG